VDETGQSIVVAQMFANRGRILWTCGRIIPAVALFLSYKGEAIGCHGVLWEDPDDSPGPAYRRKPTCDGDLLHLGIRDKQYFATRH
jgi:hypothetical protein